MAATKTLCGVLHTMSKNIINEIPLGRGTSSATSTQWWYAPNDGSRTNIAKPARAVSIPEQGEGYGIELDEINGLGPDTESEIVDIILDDGTTDTVARYRYPGQVDTEYLDFVKDFTYQDGALKVIIKKACWLHIEGTMVTIGPALGSGTDTTGLCIRRSNQVAWYGPPIMGSTVINEAGGNGIALGISSTHYYRPGDMIKFAIMTTFPTEVRKVNIESGAMHCESYLAITRISS